MNYQYITDFHASRKNRIGASDIPWCIPHPEIQIESLAAYSKDGKRHACTALDLWNEKVNGKDYEYNFAADMGHRLEGYALYEFIADNISRDVAREFMRGYDMHKMEQEQQNNENVPYNVCVHSEPYNNTPLKHNTESQNDYGVAHADCLYDPDGLLKKDWDKTIKKNGLTIDLSKPFLIEAKSARLYTVSARKNDIYKGYDLSLKTWQGVPLKVYFQCQFQMALYDVDVCYLSLIFDTSEKHYWQIKRNKKHQRELIQIAQYMKKCIDEKTPPKERVMNSKDIQKLYPIIKDDFRELDPEELKDILELATDEIYAASQEKLWKRKKEDANEAASLFLKDTEMVKGIVNETLLTIYKWKSTGGATSIMGLADIKKRDDGKRLVRYLEKNKLIKVGDKNRKPSVVIKKDELESVSYDETFDSIKSDREKEQSKSESKMN